MRWVVPALFGLLVVLALVAAWLYQPDLPRGELEARYAGPPSTFIDVAGLRLHVRDTGPRDAPALILLHGFGSSLHTWEPWAAQLDGALRVIRIDVPGFALTGPDPRDDYTDARAHAVLLALLDRLGLRRASVGGHSMGGRIAWSFAASHPERVERLLLLAPDGFATPGFTYGKAPEVPPLLRLLPYVLPTALLRQTLLAAYSDPAMVTNELVVRTRDLLLAPGVRRAILRRTEQQVLTDPVPRLAQIAAPTLILWGQRDAMIPEANAEDFRRAIPGARLTVFPDTGHVLHEEAADASAAAARVFLLP